MKKKETKKREIIENSSQLMHLYGYNGTSVKDVTDVAGIPKGSFYNYFTGKEDYAKEVIHYFADHEKYIEILDDQSKQPLERIVALFEKKINDFENEGFKCGCFVGNLTQEMGDVSEVIAQATEEFYQELTEKIGQCLKEAEEVGDFNSKLESETIANFIVNAWQGVLLRMKSQQGREPLDGFMQVLKEILL
ncbi:TetR/AcrR family transcriptional regulator [Halanaerobaculum tunisiense]